MTNASATWHLAVEALESLLVLAVVSLAFL
jgi:hypothetical protein